MWCCNQGSSAIQGTDGIIDARFVSFYSVGPETNKACKINLATKEVFDIEVSEEDNDRLVDEHYDEHVIIDGRGYSVVCRDYRDVHPEENSYWYS